jgi:hypothetical protein
LESGLLFIFIVATIVDVALHATGVFPPIGKAMSVGSFVLRRRIASSSASPAAT